MAKAPTKIETTSNGKNLPMNISDADNLPDYLQSGEHSIGLEGFGSQDFKIPRILLLQPLSPQVQQFPGVAKPGEFWHTAGNCSLGNDLDIIVAAASRRVILFNPRHLGGGILAFSRDGRTWDGGANSTFEVQPYKDNKNLKVVWKTGKDVASSRLTEWGSMDPNDPKSQPAANLIYEYLLMLPDKVELSPCVFGVYKTGLSNARNFNTIMLMRRKPIQSALVKMRPVLMTEGQNNWFVPQFDLQKGFATRDQYEMAKSMEDRYKNYAVDIEQAMSESEPKDSGAASNLEF